MNPFPVALQIGVLDELECQLGVDGGTRWRRIDLRDRSHGDRGGQQARQHDGAMNTPMRSNQGPTCSPEPDSRASAPFAARVSHDPVVTDGTTVPACQHGT